jgi:putative nucleotidyltransferase with HDIG domain
MSYPVKELEFYKKSLKDTQEIKRLNNLKDVITRVNNLLLYVKNEKQLYQKICEILMRTGNYFFTWIGIYDLNNDKITCVAYSGLEEDYSSLTNLSSVNSENIKNPIILTLETGKVNIVKNINSTPFFKLFNKEKSNGDYKSMVTIPLIHDKKTIGNLNIYSVVNDSFKIKEMKILKEVANDISIGIKSLRYEKELENNYFRFKKTLYETIDAIAMISERRDPYTAGHQKRVAVLASAIAKEMKLDEEKIEGIYLTAILHDIGKMSVPLSILSKPSKLSEGEVMLIQSHCEEAYNILKNIQFPWPVAQTILQHHERLDGSGYPKKLMDKDILIEAKILAVADTIEAMSSHRPYRPAIGLQRAIKEIIKNKGKLYDSQVVDICVDLVENNKFKF